MKAWYIGQSVNGQVLDEARLNVLINECVIYLESGFLHFVCDKADLF